MTAAPLDLEAEYDNRKRVADSGAILARWTSDSSAYRAAAESVLDIAYGPGERQRYDLFHPPGRPADAPVVAFIHGGYWQRLDRKDVSFVARGLNQRGVAVAVPSYTLCPAGTVAGIVDEMRHFAAALVARLGRRALFAGHSAGGQLAAILLASSWTDASLPKPLVTHAMALSGVFDLVPLVSTTLNEALRLDGGSARAVSPMFWPAPGGGGTLIAAVGGDESREFLRQSLEMAGRWGRPGTRGAIRTETVIIPARNHFTIVDDLADADSLTVARLAALAREVQPA